MGMMNQPTVLEHILITTKVEKIINWSRATSVWPMTFGLACCAIEMMAAGASRFDLARFGAEVFRATPRQSDLMIVAGTVTYKMAAHHQAAVRPDAGTQMGDRPGQLRHLRGPVRQLPHIQGVDKVVPVDVYIPGCPPRPESLIYGFMKLQDKIMASSMADRYKEIFEAGLGAVRGSAPYGTLCSGVPVMENNPNSEPETQAGPCVYDLKAAPNRQVVLPKTVPLPSLKLWQAEQEAAAAAEAAKWQKTLADYEAAKAKAEAEGKDAPKPPVRPVAKPDANDMKFPAPAPATDPDLLRLQEVLGDKVEEAFQQAGELTCQVAREAVQEALRLCRDDDALHYEMLADETATHYPAAKDFAFSVVYHLTSIRRRKRLRLRILIPEGFEPDTAATVYPTANWLEREIWDMLGIRFSGHPDMTRILCPEGWEGHALRKEYPVLGPGPAGDRLPGGPAAACSTGARWKRPASRVSTSIPPKAE